jgi:hypothetical protein
MTTEAPLLKDGAQCVAAANYWNPATALYGPYGSGQFLCVFISAARTVSLQTTQGGIVYGVLQNAPAAGQAADVSLHGITKVVVGAAVAAGAELMVDTNGRAITWVGGAGNRKIGQAIEAAAAANAVIDMEAYTPNISVLT